MKYGRKISRHFLNEIDLEKEEKEVWVNNQEAEELKEKYYFLKVNDYPDQHIIKFKEIGRIKNYRYFLN